MFGIGILISSQEKETYLKLSLQIQSSLLVFLLVPMHNKVCNHIFDKTPKTTLTPNLEDATPFPAKGITDEAPEVDLVKESNLTAWDGPNPCWHGSQLQTSDFTSSPAPSPKQASQLSLSTVSQTLFYKACTVRG